MHLHLPHPAQPLLTGRRRRRTQPQHSTPAGTSTPPSGLGEPMPTTVGRAEPTTPTTAAAPTTPTIAAAPTTPTTVDKRAPTTADRRAPTDRVERTPITVRRAE